MIFYQGKSLPLKKKKAEKMKTTFLEEYRLNLLKLFLIFIAECVITSMKGNR